MLKRDLYYEGIPTKSQRDDTRYLGDILGRVIRKQEGQNFFNLVEKIRLLSKANIKNKNNKDRFKKITSEIQRLKPIKIFSLPVFSNPDFEVGEKVQHKEFGSGTILGISDKKLQIRFENSDEKQNQRAFLFLL